MFLVIDKPQPTHSSQLCISNGIVLSAPVTKYTSGASFMPVSRIFSRCAFSYRSSGKEVCVTITDYVGNRRECRRKHDSTMGKMNSYIMSLWGG